MDVLIFLGIEKFSMMKELVPSTRESIRQMVRVASHLWTISTIFLTDIIITIGSRRRMNKKEKTRYLGICLPKKI